MTLNKLQTKRIHWYISSSNIPCCRARKSSRFTWNVLTAPG